MPNGKNYEIKTTYTNYNAFGSPKTIAMTTPRDGVAGNDNSSTMTYTADGRFIQSKTNGAFTTNYEYDDLTHSYLIAETAPSGLTTRYFYNGLGQKYKTLSPTGVESYSTLNWVPLKFSGLPDDTNAPADALYYALSKTSGIAEVKTYYNAKGQERRTISRGFNNEIIYTDKEYDNKDRLWKESMPYFLNSTKRWTTYAYDEPILERLSAVTAPDGTVSETIYDDANRKITSKVTKNNVTQQSIKTSNALGQVSISEDNMGNQVHYIYDEAGRLKESWVNDNTTKKTVFTYDDIGNRLSIKDPDAGTIASTYDALGNLQTQKNAEGETSTYAYDEYGRMASETTLGETTSYSYLTSGVAIGQLDQIKLGGVLQEKYTYDQLGRMNSKSEYVDGLSFTHSNTYDDYGRIATQTYPNDYTIANVYNAQGDLSQITQGGQVIYENIGFDALGALTDYNLGSNNATRSYDELGRLTYQGCSSFQSMMYDYDDMGNLDYRQDNVHYEQMEEFAYDNLNRLSGIEYAYRDEHVSGTEKYITYDATGNIQSKTGIGAGMTYGENGKPHALTSINIPLGYQPTNQNITYTYFNKADLITQGTYTYQYTYGIDHQRNKTVYKDGNTVKRTKYYLGDYEKVVQQDGTIKEYHYLSADCGMFGIFVKTNGVGKLYYTLADHLGSLTEIIDASTSLLVKSQSFGAWGTVRDANDWSRSLSGVEVLADRGFTGHEHLPSVFGLIDMNGRMYDPVLGRFLSPDPYVQSPDYAQNFNRYAYCYNNPLVYTDPDGEWFVVDDLVSFCVGGVINVAFNLGEIDNLGEALGYFASGGVGSWIAVQSFGLAAPLGAAITTGGNALLETNVLTEDVSFSDLSNDDWLDIGKKATIGFATGYIGNYAGEFSSNHISNKISNEFWKESVDRMVVGGITNGLESYSSAVWVDGLDWDSKEAFIELGKGTGTGIAMGFSYTVVENKVVEPGFKRVTDIKLSFKFKDNEYNLNIKNDSYWYNQPYITPPQKTPVPDSYWNNQPYLNNK